jgi:hypothetical protein
MELNCAIAVMLNLNTTQHYTDNFTAPEKSENDFRYSISPKKESAYIPKPYMQVFGDTFIPNLSIIDLIFNLGPEAAGYL